MSLDDNMTRVLDRRQQIEDQLSDSASLSPDMLASLSRELSELRPVAEQVEVVQKLKQDLAEAQEILSAGDDDAEMLEMAQLEIDQLAPQLEDAEQQLKILLLPRDTDDSRNAILEVRAGTGGEEAALFASDLFGMYQRFASRF
ncbi:MAG: PCRF domain-containing protein, partial [Candidatus Puniceispirillaceae bacterium]